MTSKPGDSPPDAQNGPQDGPEAPEGPEGPPDRSDGPSDDRKTFDAAYVKELRDENAKYRNKAKKADDLASRLVTSMAAATGRLADPTDLPFSDDLVSDDGMPDADKVRVAIDDLLTKKPHLASTRVTGDVGQGARQQQDSVSLAAMLRAGAG